MCEREKEERAKEERDGGGGGHLVILCNRIDHRCRETLVVYTVKNDRRFPSLFYNGF